jgi:hypothetical protein
MKKEILFLCALFTITLLAGCSRSAAPSYAEIPAGKAFVDGQEIFFSHTEVSDPDVAQVLTKMMKSPVITVPSLANVPDESLSEVYVFKNGIAGSGPLDYQPDVFTSQPGEADYSPLRRVIFVTWANESGARLLKSDAEIQSLAASGEIALERSDVIVNMPFMTWDGGKR